MFSFIPSETRFDFLAARKKAFAFSAFLIVGSLALLIIKGPNAGIEFEGGSSAIVAFEKDTIQERQTIADSIRNMIVTELGTKDPDVSVQDFGAGAGDEIEGREVNRFLIYTSIPSLVGKERATEIEAKLKERFGPETQVTTSEDAGDTMYLSFGEAADITARKAELAELFKEIGYESITVTSDTERQIEVEFLRDLDLLRQDQERNQAGAQAETAEATLPGEADFERRRAEAIAGKSDTQFTVDIEALQVAFGKALDASFGDSFITVESSAMVSPSVGEDLRNDGMLAILYSLIGILVYVTLRFDFRYAPGGVVALLHDGIVTMGMVSLLDLKFSLQVLAAVLTVIGYSINDSIIVYDRVRENLAMQKGKSLIDTLNQSINMTLSRTVITSGTTLLAIGAILAFGGAQISDFALTMFFGILFGTYSSVYIAVPFVLYLDTYLKRRAAEKKSESRPGGKHGGGSKRDKKDGKKTARASA